MITNGYEDITRGDNAGTRDYDSITRSYRREREGVGTIGLDWLGIGCGEGCGTNTNNDDITRDYDSITRGDNAGTRDYEDTIKGDNAGTIGLDWLERGMPAGLVPLAWPSPHSFPHSPLS